GKVADDLWQAHPAEQFARGVPAGDAVVANVPTRIAGEPDVAVDVAAHAVGPALDPVDDTVGKLLHVRHRFAVGAHVEDPHVALATGDGVARPLAGAGDIQLLEVRREAQAVRVRHLVV